MPGIVERFANPGNVTDPVNLFQYVGSITSNLFGIMILFAIFSISFVAMRADSRAFLAAMGITTLSSVFLAAIQILDPNMILVTAAITGVGVFFTRSQ